MPEDKGKTKDKSKNEKNNPKQQRAARNKHARNETNRNDTISKTAVDKPTVEPPIKSIPTEPNVGPEFYENIKKERLDILKNEQSENSKYSKRGLTSNWQKYETLVPEFRQQESVNMGADFEQLVQMPLSTGGHFQFKHEKNWETRVKKSEYDKYFEFDAEKLSTALSTIPFYIRNDLDSNIFSEGEHASMRTRLLKFKGIYTNFDSSPVRSLKEETQKQSISELLNETEDIDLVSNKDEKPKPTVTQAQNQSDMNIKSNNLEEINMKPSSTNVQHDDDELNELISTPTKKLDDPSEDIPIDIVLDLKDIDIKGSNIAPEKKVEVLEPTEDLEQWLDDFLDS